jgi:glycerol-3-phosphate dehydrogenase (NAD(P)+)
MLLRAIADDTLTHMNIAVIGDGAMGTVCASMLAENGHHVNLWSAFSDAADEMRRFRENRRFLPGLALSDRIDITSDGAAALQAAELVISAVPTQFCRGVWKRLSQHCPAAAPVCSVAKGIENHTLLRPTQVLSELMGPRPLAALSGPSIAPEIARGLPATVVAASPDAALARDIQRAITRPHFRVYTNADILGVELAGATKNVIAIAAGVLDGLQYGDNAKAALLTRGLVEITRLGVTMGAQAETFAGLAGMGDLVTTCTSPLGRNRSLGEAIGRGATLQRALAQAKGVVEGVATTESVVELAKRVKVEMPLTRGVYDVLFGGQSPRQAINELMTRPLKAE